MEIARVVDDVLAEPPRASPRSLLDAAVHDPAGFQGVVDADPQRARAVLARLDVEIVSQVGDAFAAIIDSEHTGRERSPSMVERLARGLARRLAAWPAAMRPAILRAADRADRARYDNTYGNWEAGWIRDAIRKRLGADPMALADLVAFASDPESTESDLRMLLARAESDRASTVAALRQGPEAAAALLRRCREIPETTVVAALARFLEASLGERDQP